LLKSYFLDSASKLGVNETQDSQALVVLEYSLAGADRPPVPAFLSPAPA
jgi:hypothetical protein